MKLFAFDQCGGAKAVHNRDHEQWCLLRRRDP
jgi:hypothetical protein